MRRVIHERRHITKRLEVAREFTPIERELLRWVDVLGQIGRQFNMELEDVALLLDMDLAIFLRRFPVYNPGNRRIPADGLLD